MGRVGILPQGLFARLAANASELDVVAVDQWAAPLHDKRRVGLIRQIYVRALWDDEDPDDVLGLRQRDALRLRVYVQRPSLRKATVTGGPE